MSEVDAIVAETNLRLRLFAAWEKIGPNAKAILCVVAERLALGAERYPGEDFTSGRDWRQEAHEEHLDGLIYSVRATLP